MSEITGAKAAVEVLDSSEKFEACAILDHTGQLDDTGWSTNMENFDNSKKRIREEEDEYLDSLSPAPFLAGGDNIIKSAHQFKSSHANIGSTPEIPSNAINLLINSNPQSKDASPSNAPCVPANSIYDDGNDADKSVTYDTENIGSTQKFNFDNNRLNTDNTHLKTKEPLFEDELSRSRAKNGEEEEEYDNYENVHEKLVENPPIENDNNLPALKPRKLVLQKYTVYETDERMYIIGSNNRETMFRILEIDLTSPMENLNVIEDNVYFNRKEIIQILSTLEETKNLAKRISCYGLLGFVKFTKHYYLQTVTERSIVGILGGHYIYKIDSTKLVPIICEAGFNTYKKSTSKEELDNEQRFLSIFEGFSLDENFYFSYTYDISNTLQKNFLNEKFKAFQNKVSQKVNKGQNSKNQDDRDAYGISNSSVLNNSTSLHEASRSMNDEKHVNNKSNLKNREDASTNYTDSELELNEVDNEELVQKLLGTDEEAENYLGVYNEMFVWNTALLRPAVKVFDRTFDWFQPVIHGFFNQANISIYNKKIYITLIARRSHHFAGARFLKRGVNDKGNVANEVETEQIVCDGVTTSFHDPTNGFCMNSNYSSFVQHRGSIPLYWTQDITNINKIAKPPIIIKLTDPFYSTSALHFDKLFKRYGPKISILNLIKQKEKTARESKLGKEFRECIDFLNHSLPEAHKLDYVAWDMSRASKTGSHGQAVLEFLETYADTVIDKVGLFHNSTTQNSDNLQIGVCRTNCIDCLDRTNAAQLIIGKKALGYQLKKLGIYDNVFLEYDSDAVNLLTTLYQKHGNTIALQYGGSNLVNTMETYRKINQWSSKKNDLIENVKRFYSNSFVDPLRQDTINLFLGNYSFEKLGSKFFLWDLPNDYYLHNDIGISKLHSEKMRSFSFWWNENVLKYWKNIQFPPRNYLLNGELDDFALNKNSRLYDKKSFENAVRKILAELIIDQDLSLTTKRVFTAENASKFTGFRIRFRNSKGKKKSKRPKGKQFFVSRLNELAEMISNIDQSLFLIEYKAKLYKDTKLEPYYGKQTDSYWGEYYAPRKLTNFKLLFDMNMKSSLTIDAKELSGAHFADENSKATDGSGIVLTKEDHGNDINPNSTVDPNTSYNSHLNFTSTNNYGTQGDTSFAGATNSSASPFDYANSKLQTPLFEVSPFESRKPGLINQKFRQLYKHETGSFGKANDRNSKPVKLEKEEIAAKLAEIDDFMKFLWPSLTRYDIDDDSVEQDLEASLINGLEQETDQDEENALSLSILQLKLVIKANEYLNSYIFNLCKDLYGSLAYSYNYLENEETEEMDFDHEKSDEDYHSDTSVSHYETGYESDYNYNIKDNNKRHFHHIYRSPKHKKKQKTKKHQSEKQKQKKKLDHQHPSRQNKLLSGYDSSQKGSSKMLADGRSQSNNKSISPGASSRASHPAPKRQYSTYSLPSRLPGGVSRQSKLNSKHVTNNYIDITTKGYEPSILSSSTNNHSCSNYEDYLFAPYIPPKSLEMYHENVSLKEPEYFYSELKDTTRNQSNEKVFKDSNYKTHDYDADDTAIFSNEYELQDDKYGLETIIMNPSIYREKYQEYQFSISIEQHGDILQKDLDIYKFSLGIGEPHTNKTAVSSGFGNHGSKNYYGSDVGNDENPTYSHFDNTQSVHYTNSLNNAYFGHGNDPGDETYDTVPYPDAYSNDYAESAESNGNESIYESILKNSLQYVDLRASNSSFPEKGKDVYHDASENFEGWGYEDGGVGGRNENVMKFYDIYAFQN